MKNIKVLTIVGALTLLGASFANAQYDWAAGYGTQNAVSTASLKQAAFDNQNNLIAMGGVTGSNPYQMAVAKFDVNGNFLWEYLINADQYNTVSNTSNSWRVKTDAGNNIYVAGSFYGTLTFGTNSITSNGLFDGVIFKLNSSGAFQWKYQIRGGANGQVTAFDLAVSSGGEVYSIMKTLNAISIGSNNISANNDFMLKLDISGNLLWAVQTSSANADNAYAMLMNRSGNPVLYHEGILSGSQKTLAKKVEFNQSSGVALKRDSLVVTLASGINFPSLEKIRLSPDGNRIILQGQSYTTFYAGTHTINPGSVFMSYLLSANASLNVLKDASVSAGLYTGDVASISISNTGEAAFQVMAKYAVSVNNLVLSNVPPNDYTWHQIICDSNLIFHWESKEGAHSGYMGITNNITDNQNHTVFMGTYHQASLVFGCLPAISVDYNLGQYSKSFLLKVAYDIVVTLNNCPANITSCSPIVSWGPPVAKEACNISLSSNYPPGSFFPAGTTTVNYIADDGKGHTAICSFNVSVVPNPVVSFTVTNASCSTCADGAINLTITGGAGPYTFLWSNNATTEDISGLTPDTYNVIATGQGGCSAQGGATVGIQESCPAPVNVTTTNITKKNAKANWVYTGGIPAKYNLWYKPSSSVTWTKMNNLSATSTAFTMKNLTANTNYVWQVRAQCTITSPWSTQAHFTTLAAKLSSETASLPDMKLYPNPSTGLLNILLTQGNESQVIIRVVNMIGQQVYRSDEGSISGGIQKEIDFTSMPSGNYFVIVMHDGTITVRQWVIDK